MLLAKSTINRTLPMIAVGNNKKGIAQEDPARFQVPGCYPGLRDA
jgi:hypothetical protein